jgi:uncharacterized protein YceH (UPF0502 family)
VVRLPRRPGQKEERFEHRLSEDHEDAASPPATAGGEDDRLERLERQVAALAAELAELRAAIGSR